MVRAATAVIAAAARYNGQRRRDRCIAQMRFIVVRRVEFVDVRVVVVVVVVVAIVVAVASSTAAAAAAIRIL